MSSSIVARVRLGAALASVVAALMAATGTSVVAAIFLDRVDERRLTDAAMVLAEELDEDGASHETFDAIVADELREMHHTGIVFAIFDPSGAQRLAGDTRVAFAGGAGCRIDGPLRSCAAHTTRGPWAVSAEPHDRLIAPFVWASLIAAAVAGSLGWLVSSVLARWLTAPLTSLRDHVGAVEVGKGSRDLGPLSHVVEVDDLRNALTTLMGRVDEAISTAERFAADAAHELRTPLTAIRGELELALETPTPATADIARIRDKTVELQTLVERILMLALPEASGHYATELVAIDELAADVANELRASVEVTATAAPAVVRGDSVLLAVMLSNALGNALKFGKTARVVITPSSTSVVIAVEDDGPGVRPEMREAVFRPFIRDMQHARAPGRGLGLAVIANIVRRHGGSARFADTTTGARLEIDLPRADVSSAAGAKPL